MLRDLFVSALVIGILPQCFRRPFIGILMFTLLAYMRLQDLTWGFAKYERWSYYVAIATLAGYFFGRARTPFMISELRTWIMVLLTVLVGVGMLTSGMLVPGDGKVYTEFLKIVGVALFTTGVTKDRGHLRVLLWVIALSFGFYGLKGGLQGIATFGRMEILQGPGGMIKDRNDFALALTMAVPMLFHLAWAEKREALRRIGLILVPLTGLTIMFTHSRGAFLALGMTALVMVWRSRNRLAGISVMALLGVAAFLLAPASYVERISSIASYNEDGSAQGRLDAWIVAGNMIQSNPVMGVGYSKFEENYYAYDPKKAEFIAGGTLGRVAHNSYLQIWAECGTPAFILYILLLVISFFDVWRVRALARARYHSSWILSYANMFEASLVAFTVGSFFLNRAQFDLFYHMIALAVVFGRVARLEMQNERAYPLRVPQGRGRRTLETVRRPGFGHRAPRRGFRNTPLVPEPV